MYLILLMLLMCCIFLCLIFCHSAHASQYYPKDEWRRHLGRMRAPLYPRSERKSAALSSVHLDQHSNIVPPDDAAYGLGEYWIISYYIQWWIDPYLSWESLYIASMLFRLDVASTHNSEIEYHYSDKVDHTEGFMIYRTMLLKSFISLALE